VSSLPDPDRQHPAGRRDPAHHVLVSDLPGMTSPYGPTMRPSTAGANGELAVA